MAPRQPLLEPPYDKADLERAEQLVLNASNGRLMLPPISEIPPHLINNASVLAMTKDGTAVFRNRVEKKSKEKKSGKTLAYHTRAVDVFFHGKLLDAVFPAGTLPRARDGVDTPADKQLAFFIGLVMELRVGLADMEFWQDYVIDILLDAIYATDRALQDNYDLTSAEPDSLQQALVDSLNDLLKMETDLRSSQSFTTTKSSIKTKKSGAKKDNLRRASTSKAVKPVDSPFFDRATASEYLTRTVMMRAKPKTEGDAALHPILAGSSSSAATSESERAPGSSSFTADVDWLVRPKDSVYPGSMRPWIQDARSSTEMGFRSVDGKTKGARGGVGREQRAVSQPSSGLGTGLLKAAEIFPQASAGPTADGGRTAPFLRSPPRVGYDGVQLSPRSLNSAMMRQSQSHKRDASAPLEPINAFKGARLDKEDERPAARYGAVGMGLTKGRATLDLGRFAHAPLLPASATPGPSSVGVSSNAPLGRFFTSTGVVVRHEAAKRGLEVGELHYPAFRPAPVNAASIFVESVSAPAPTRVLPKSRAARDLGASPVSIKQEEVDEDVSTLGFWDIPSDA